MRHTTFEFSLRLKSDQPEGLLKSIEDRLKVIKNVKEVRGTLGKPFSILLVGAAFEDPDAAKKLHRRVVNALKKMEGVSVTRATSNLTEIFGQGTTEVRE